MYVFLHKAIFCLVKARGKGGKEFQNSLARFFTLHVETCFLKSFPNDPGLPLGMYHYSLVLGQKGD